MPGARQIVDGPAFSTLPFGLWDSLQQRDATDPHWQNGITWQDFCPNSVGMSMYEECITVTGSGTAPPPMPTLTANVTRTDRGATPFSVYAEFDGSPIGLDTNRAAADTALMRVENYHLEHAFWTGVAASQTVVWPHLAANTLLLDNSSPQIVLQPAASPVVTGGAGPARALGALEDQLASCYVGQGYVHVTSSVLNALVGAYLIDMDDVRDGKLRTPRGNIVVVGGGYTGSSPAGAAPAAGTAWMYATGAVFGYRSPVYVRVMPEDFDRAKNTVKMLAYRTYTVAFECCLIAALVNLPT